MDRLPITRHLWMLVFLISLGGFFEVYDLIFTGYIAPGMAKSGLLQTTTHSFFGFNGIAGFIAATFAGLFVGTFGFGWLPDRYGRRTVFTFSLLWYSVGSAIMAFQTTPEGVILWRFITGIGVGIEIVTIDSYVTELVPQHMRGRAMAFNQMVMFAAAPVAAILSYWLVPTTRVRHRRMARRGARGIGRRGARVVHSPGRAGKPALARDARPRGEGRPGRREDRGDRRAASSGKPLPPPLPVIEQPAASPRVVRGAAAAAVPLAPDHADRLQLLPGDRLLRLRQLGADAADRAGHHGDEEPAVFVRHRDSRCRSARCSRCSTRTRSSANG